MRSTRYLVPTGRLRSTATLVLAALAHRPSTMSDCGEASCALLLLTVTTATGSGPLFRSIDRTGTTLTAVDGLLDSSPLKKATERSNRSRGANITRLTDPICLSELGAESARVH